MEGTVTSVSATSVTATMDNVSNKIQSYNKELSTLQDQLVNPVCKCCNQKLDIDTVQVRIRIDVITTDLAGLQRRYNESKETQTELQLKLNHEQHRLQKEIQHYEQQLAIAKYKNEQYEVHSSNVKKLQADNVKLTKSINASLKEQEVLTAIINSIKAGTPFKTLISHFCEVLNLYIKQYAELMSTTFTVIKAIPKKNSVELVTTDTRFNKIVNFTDYSGGELTRLRIVVLMSVLNAVQTITNVSTNILVFDEALDTLDSNAAQDLSNLFEYLSNNDNKFVALVSHGSQLNEIKFDGDITVTKHNGVSNVTQGV
jgi:DNA repair exonuclease SbcCD ATPase subunit